MSVFHILKDGLVLVRLWFSTVRTSLALLRWAIWIPMAIGSLQSSMRMTRNGGNIVRMPPLRTGALIPTREPMCDDEPRGHDL